MLNLLRYTNKVFGSKINDISNIYSSEKLDSNIFNIILTDASLKSYNILQYFCLFPGSTSPFEYSNTGFRSKVNFILLE